jgi:beta-lysine 5,6-aminomutase alpha subunit
MPPTKHKTGDIFQAHVHDAMFNLVGITTNQSIELLGMFSEAVHNPMLMDRYLSLKAAKYVYNACKHLGDEIEFKADGIIARRAAAVLAEAHDLLQLVESETIWTAIARGDFADVKRSREGGKGFAGVVARDPDYVNPLLDALEAE